MRQKPLWHRMLFQVAWLALAMGVAMSTPSQAGVPQTLNYQGLLTNASGQPINAPASAPLKITVALYNALQGGTALYTEPHTTTVTNGVFEVVIGSITPLNLAFDVPYYLEITLGQNPGETLQPRLPLASSAYALRSGCNPGDRVSCYDFPTGAPGVGPCATGVRVCNSQGTGYGSCVGEVGPNCGTVCANLQTDPANCGSCGAACPTANGTPSCSSGACSITCNTGTVKCGATTCSNLSTDPSNCGSCGTVCKTGASCSSGQCVCPTGTTSCFLGCFNTSTSTSNCGACGRACLSGQVCTAGVCN